MKHNITKLSIFMVTLVFSFCSLFSQFDEEQIKKNLPKLLGANNVGKDFWITIPPCSDDVGGNNYIKLYVTTPSNTIIYVNVPGKGWTVQKKSIPNDVVEFNITPSVGQPYLHSADKEPPSEKVYRGFGIHIYADQPLVVYCVVRYKYTSDGFLAYPVSSLGREYISCSYGDMGAMYNGNYPSELGIVSPYDDNIVKFTMGGNIVSKTAGGLKPGEAKTEVMQKGDAWMFSSLGYDGDLTGSKIVSSKPVSVVSGNFCTNIPTSNRWCDYTVEMDLPTYIWSKTYHIPIIHGRKYASLLRIFARLPGTSIYRDGVMIAKLQEAGGLLGKGWLEIRSVPMGEKIMPVVYTADKPIGITLCNTGVQEDGYPLPNSDPFTMALLPVELYTDSITLITPGIDGVQNFKENYLDLIYETNENGEMPDDMIFGTVQNKEFVYQKLKEKFPVPDTPYNYDIKGRKYSMKQITLPADGMYRIHSKKPFAAYSYGYDWCDSYGFPSGIGAGNEETKDLQKPIPTWTMECTGSVKNGHVIDKPDVDSVRSNLSAIYLNPGSYNYKLTTSKIEADITREAQWQLEVINNNLASRAIVEFWDGSGNDTSIIIQNNMSAVSIDRDTVMFGNLYPDSVYYQNILVTNNNKSQIKITELKLKNGSAGFSLKDLKLPLTIDPGDNIELNIKFQSHKTGNYTDTLIIGDGCVNLFKSIITAKITEPVIAVNNINFGNVLAGELYTKTFTITNLSNIEIIITGIKGNYLTEFKHNLGIVSDTNPIKLPANGTKTVVVTFYSDTIGSFKDSITFISPAGSKLDNVAFFSAECILRELASNNWEWGRVRIHKDSDPSGPYGTDSIPGQPRAIMFVNNSSRVIKVNGIGSIIENKPGDKNAFVYN